MTEPRTHVNVLTLRCARAPVFAGYVQPSRCQSSRGGRCPRQALVAVGADLGRQRLRKRRRRARPRVALPDHALIGKMQRIDEVGLRIYSPLLDRGIHCARSRRPSAVRENRASLVARQFRSSQTSH